MAKKANGDRQTDRHADRHADMQTSKEVLSLYFAAKNKNHHLLLVPCNKLVTRRVLEIITYGDKIRNIPTKFLMVPI